ncbi:hypothetical protein BGZ94_010403 [Podila epigama]|nr:hypothetical protein BGZ94_010403 [Podila epigama]
MATCRQLSRLDWTRTMHHLTGVFQVQRIQCELRHSTLTSNRFFHQGFSSTRDSIRTSTARALYSRHHRTNTDALSSIASTRSFLGLTKQPPFTALHGGVRSTSSSSSSSSSSASSLSSSTPSRAKFLDLPVVKRPLIRYTPPGPPPPGQKHQTLTLYTITSIPEAELHNLRDAIFERLVKFEITGRIYLAKDGINLHLCSPTQHLAALQTLLQDLVLDCFGRGPDGAIWNFSTEAPTEERVFSKLKVMVKKQLVADGRLGQWNVLDAEAPQYLEPAEFHARLDQVGDKALLIDMRNHFENEVGRFKTSVKMDCTTFKENMDLMDSLLENRDKDKEVLMVCTGGIRCSVSGRYLKQKGFSNVKMLKGGITSYGRYIKSNPGLASHFIGKNFTFDGRRGERITKDVVSTCHQCSSPNDHITNCANVHCHLLFIQCPSCRQKWKNTCGPDCRHTLETGTGPAASKPYDYHAQVRPSLHLHEISEAA